jgi:hypothetical protein
MVHSLVPTILLLTLNCQIFHFPFWWQHLCHSLQFNTLFNFSHSIHSIFILLISKDCWLDNTTFISDATLCALHDGSSARRLNNQNSGHLGLIFYAIHKIFSYTSCAGFCTCIPVARRKTFSGNAIFHLSYENTWPFIAFVFDCHFYTSINSW